MSGKRATLGDLLSPEVIRELARPSDVRYGEAIHKRGGVVYIEYAESKAEAWVGGLSGSVAEGGGQRRRTQIFVRSEKLQWHCAGNPKSHQICCKHCVALALAVMENSSRSA